MRALAAAFAGAVLSLIPATAALAAAPKPDISVTGQADKATYAVGDTFKITVTVKNTSSVDAKHVHYTGGEDGGVSGVTYTEFKTGFDLAAGATKTVLLSGKIEHMAFVRGHGFVAFDLGADNGEANLADNQINVALVVPGAFGTVTGFVSEGADSNAPYDPAKGIAKVVVTVKSEDGKTKYGEATTDDKGAYKITQVPAGIIQITFTPPAGWKILAGEDGQSDTTPGEVQGDQESRVSVVAKRVAVPSSSASPAPSASAAAGPALPVTGSNTPLIVGAGLAAVVVGAALVLIARRRRVHLQA
ncbi:SdrD B-like domain-containing protein [Dactylosporangium sp. CS-047395]|uniref:SdrD B-like domain-containing protein n=1 Tax=Dactylosporangium sp. CS-047395 TaxID=3239936 RepID=UPI003D8AED26